MRVWQLRVGGGGLAGEPWQVGAVEQCHEGIPEPAGPLPDRLPRSLCFVGFPCPSSSPRALCAEEPCTGSPRVSESSQIFLLEPPVSSLFSCPNTAASLQPKVLPDQKGHSPTPCSGFMGILPTSTSKVLSSFINKPLESYGSYHKSAPCSGSSQRRLNELLSSPVSGDPSWTIGSPQPPGSYKVWFESLVSPSDIFLK